MPRMHLLSPAEHAAFDSPAVFTDAEQGRARPQPSRAIVFGHHQESLHGEKIEPEIAEGCRRLIKNASICRNDLYLSQRIAGEDMEQ